MPRWITLIALVLMLAPAIGALAEPAKAELYQAKSGTYAAAEVRSITLTDKARDKDLTVRISYPKVDAGVAQKFPLIIFSHGAMGAKELGDPLVDHWVSHGYIVLRPTHGDSLTLLTPEEKRKAMFRMRKYVNSEAVLGQWDDRPADIKFILDSLADIETKAPVIANRIDRTRIAHGGHSFGAHTAMMLAGLNLKHPTRPGQRVQLDDKRLRCFVMVSPQGPGNTIDAKSYNAIKKPALFITGDNDGSPIRGQENKAGTWRKTAYDEASPGDKYLLWVKDAHHDFGGINGGRRYPGAGPRNAAMVNYVKTTALAMWDAYLKDDANAKAYLKSTAIEKATEGKAKLESR